MGDHGSRYGKIAHSEKGAIEVKLPMLFMMGNTQLLNQMPNSLDILRHNSMRLVSKLDLYATFQHLVTIPFEKDLRKQKLKWEPSKQDKKSHISLLGQKISDNRNCEDAKIPAFACSCHQYIPVDTNSKEALEIAQKIVQFYKNQVSQEDSNQELCQILEFESVILSERFTQDEQNEYWRIRLLFQRGTIIEPLIYLTSSMGTPCEFRSTVAFYWEQKNVNWTAYLIQTERIDVYAGLCEDLAEMKGIEPKTCVCNQVKDINKELIQEFRDKFSGSWAEEGENCENFCKKKGQTCVDHSLKAFNDCEVLDCKECKESEEKLDILPMKLNDVCYVDSGYPEINCLSSNHFATRFCVCEN